MGGVSRSIVCVDPVMLEVAVHEFDVETEAIDHPRVFDQVTPSSSPLRVSTPDT